MHNKSYSITSSRSRLGSSIELQMSTIQPENFNISQPTNWQKPTKQTKMTQTPEPKKIIFVKPQPDIFQPATQSECTMKGI